MCSAPQQLITFAICDWHFLEVVAGSVPRWLRVTAGTLETGEEICGPGTTMLSLGSSAGYWGMFRLARGSATCFLMC